MQSDFFRPHEWAYMKNRRLPPKFPVLTGTLGGYMIDPEQEEVRTTKFDADGHHRMPFVKPPLDRKRNVYIWR